MTLNELLAKLPADALLPVGWLREQLRAEPAVGAASSDKESLLTVRELGVRLHRSPSTVRGWVEAGRFEGAFKLSGRDWRIPITAVATFIDAQQPAAVSQASAGGTIVPSPTPRPRAQRAGSKGEADLSAWRRVRKGTA